MSRTVLVTGTAGFIGFHTALRLLRRGDRVVGLDNLNDYYDVALKESRLRRLDEQPGFSTVRADLGDAAAVDATSLTMFAKSSTSPPREPTSRATSSG